MLFQFPKLTYRIFDESVVKLRRFCVKYSKNISNDYSDYEDNENESFFEEPILNNGKSPLKIDEYKNEKCIIKCRNSKLNLYENQTYSKLEPIPLASRGWHHRMSIGDYFTIYPEKSNNKGEIDKSITFKDISMNKNLIENLENKNIVNPTQIQMLSIPRILDGESLIMTAETGCGKTFAFLLPLLHQIMKWKSMLPNRKLNSPLGLIITPSKDLTMQIYKEAKQLTKNIDLNIMNFIGGNSKRFAHNPPVEDVDLIIASFGVLSKLITWKILDLHLVRHVVLDEADTLLDLSFREQMTHFLEKLPVAIKKNYKNPDFPNKVQITLSSATIPEDLSKTLHMFTDKNRLVSVTSGNEHQISVPQKFLRLGPSDKSRMLLKLVKAKVKSKTPIIIFSNTIDTCSFTVAFLKKFGIKCLSMHKDIPPSVKKYRFREFLNGNYHILTTTDAGGRGLDTCMVQEVINYDFPLITSEYIHRCGRTGRIGSPQNCRVINFISRPLEIILASKIEFALRKGKPIPMVDCIHDKNNQENEFLNYKAENKISDRKKNTHNDVDSFNNFGSISSADSFGSINLVKPSHSVNRLKSARSTDPFKSAHSVNSVKHVRSVKSAKHIRSVKSAKSVDSIDSIDSDDSINSADSDDSNSNLFRIPH